MKKVFGQTVRDLKREVNKKVLKVPGIEQKVLDATSNEAWGPHGSHLVDIAQATRNYNEYQMIMAVLWKRINDTGKNWRHVYKALTVLEYLVAYGSERVIDDIREHAYHISTLSDFQYIDSSGRDQGSNVRKKSQSLVVLVNDKERIQAARQKALANRDKYSTASSSTGGMYRPSSYSSTGGYGDQYNDDRYEGRYGNRDEDRNGYGRERELGYKDDDRYSRDGYRVADNRSNRSPDDYQYGPRHKSSDREREHSYEDNDRYTSRKLERKLSEQNVGAPPSYEEAISEAQSHIQEERDGGSETAPAPKTSSSPTGITSHQDTLVDDVAAPLANKEVHAFDEFDPHTSVSDTPPAPSTVEMDIFGSLADVASPDSLDFMLETPAATTPKPDTPVNSDFGSTFVPLSSASTVLNQPSEDLFGDSPFIALPSENNFGAQQQNFGPTTSFQPTTMNESSVPLQPDVPKMETASNFDFGDAFLGITYPPSTVSNIQPLSTVPEFLPPELSSSRPSSDSFGNFQQNFVPTTSFQPIAMNESSVPLQPAVPKVETASNFDFGDTFLGITNAPSTVSNIQPLSTVPEFLPLELSSAQRSSDSFGNHLPPSGAAASVAYEAALPDPTGPAAKAQPRNDKFEPKSTVWADTLSRGLVNLNISGPKINPLADIGIDFESINRKEKRKEKPADTPVTSTITMGKAMGSGSGVGRAGTTGLTPPPNPFMGSSMGMGMGMGGSTGMGMGMAMGSYGGGMNQPPMGMGMGMGMNMSMVQGGQMRPSTRLPPGPGMPGGYNPMMGMGGYATQQPYGGYQ
ncbi:clathrin interactor EPSIN 3-like isoform X2 [Tasmannia lanceolata]|uniref:clathrin interactor EPSIN 3-like isoform X2 n=1 Tax=Tasmannia lanceolata TaxID=3420 RepID=UPI004062F399